MKRLPFDGATYAFALPDGGAGVLYPGSRIETSERTVNLPGEDLLFLTGTRFLTKLFMAAKGHDSGKAWLWNSDGWIDHGPTFGNSPCAFGDDCLFIVIAVDRYARVNLATGLRDEFSAPIGVQGIRYIEHGIPVSGDATNRDGDLFEYTRRGDVVVGQGHESGALINGRELEPWDCRFIRFERDGDRLAVALVKQLEKRAVLFWLTVADIRSLMPPLRHRFWFGPNIGSADLVRLFDDPAALSGIGVFSLVTENILNYGTAIGPNTFEALQANHAFAKLKQAGIPLAIEGATLSDLAVVEKIHNVGGVVTFFSYSEPLTYPRGLSFDAIAEKVETFIKAGRALGVTVGWLEAWPAVPFETQRDFLATLTARGATPAYWHLDIDWNRAAKEKRDPVAFIRQCQNLATEAGVTLGLFINSTVDPIATDAAHAQNLAALAAKIHAIAPDIPQVHVAAWAQRSAGGPQDVPNNLGPSGLLASFTQIRTLFAGVTVPEPEPEPVELTNMIAYAPPMAGFAAGEFAPHPDNDGSVIVLKPNGSILCVTPDGGVEQRPKDAAGPWEKFRKGKNCLIAERGGDRVFVLPIAE